MKEDKHSLVVAIESSRGGRWDVELPGDSEPIRCDTLDDAVRVGYASALCRRPCDLVVRDAYHRVLRRQLVDAASELQER